MHRRYTEGPTLRKVLQTLWYQVNSGQEIDVIIDEIDEEGAVGRSTWDAPDIDGSVFIDDAGEKVGGNVGNLGGVTAEAVECHNQLQSAQFTLPPLSIIAFRPERVEMKSKPVEPLKETKGERAENREPPGPRVTPENHA